MKRRRLRRRPPFKAVGLLAIVVTGLVGLALYLQFRGDFTPRITSTLVTPRAGLVMNPVRRSPTTGSSRPGVQHFGDHPRRQAGRPEDAGYHPEVRQADPYNHFELGSPLVVDYVWAANWVTTPSIPEQTQH